MPRTRYRGVKTVLVEGPAGIDSLREHPAASQNNLNRPGPGACSEFFDHWDRVRDGRPVPTIIRFCEALTGPLAAACSIAELQDNAAIVRFQGVELIDRWGQDLTGRDLYDTFPYYARTRALANIACVIARPCGYFGSNRVEVPGKGNVASHFVQLPLLSEDGATAYVAHFSRVMPEAPDAHPNGRYYQTNNTGWIDLGAGVPEHCPYLLTAPRAANG